VGLKADWSLKLNFTRSIAEKESFISSEIYLLFQIMDLTSQGLNT